MVLTPNRQKHPLPRAAGRERRDWLPHHKVQVHDLGGHQLLLGVSQLPLCPLGGLRAADVLEHVDGHRARLENS